MSRLEELIQTLCPDGVEHRELAELADIGTGNSNRVDAIDDGKYPFFVRSKQVMRSNKYDFDEEAIVIPGEGGIGEIFHYIRGKYDLHQRAYRISFRDSRVNTRFAYYFMRSNFKKFITMKAVTATVISIRMPMIASFLLPIPPLPIQEEIVRVLDTFSGVVTELEQQLEAEHAARVRQYEHYQQSLLEFADNPIFEWKKIGDIAECLAGATPSTTRKEYWENGTIPWMNSGEVNLGQVFKTENKITKVGYESSSTKLVPADTVVVALAGQGKTRGKVAITRIPLCTNQSLCSIIPIKEVNSNYLYYYLKTQYQNLRTISSGDGTRGGLNLKMIKGYEVPIPSLEEQEKIVSILDRFDALVNDLKSGLPAEIALRRKQYEYYRDKLLTFQPLE